MDQVGKIEQINGNKAVVSVKRVSACGDNCKSCGASCKQESVIIETDVTSDYEVGDYVEITTENEVLLKHILVLYGVPLLIMMCVIGIVQLFSNSPEKDMISAVSALLSLVVSFFILKAYDRKEMKKNVLKLTIGKKL